MLVLVVTTSAFNVISVPISEIAPAAVSGAAVIIELLSMSTGPATVVAALNTVEALLLTFKLVIGVTPPTTPPKVSKPWLLSEVAKP